MKRRCAWCGWDMGSKEPLNDDSITHGLCLPCSAAIIQAAARETAGSTYRRWLGSPETEAPAPEEKPPANTTVYLVAEPIHG
jgi:hypothetical protein